MSQQYKPASAPFRIGRRQLLSDIRLHSDASAVLSDLRIPLTDTTRNLRTLVKVLGAQPSS